MPIFVLQFPSVAGPVSRRRVNLRDAYALPLRSMWDLAWLLPSPGRVSEKTSRRPGQLRFGCGDHRCHCLPSGKSPAVGRHAGHPDWGSASSTPRSCLPQYRQRSQPLERICPGNDRAAANLSRDKAAGGNLQIERRAPRVRLTSEVRDRVGQTARSTPPVPIRRRFRISHLYLPLLSENLMIT
jgi:hypothetical protein